MNDRYQSFWSFLAVTMIVVLLIIIVIIIMNIVIIFSLM